MLAEELRKLVIVPTLEGLDQALPGKGLASEAAVELLLGTAAHESHLGKWLVQQGGGPARGIYMIEPEELSDVLSWMWRRQMRLAYAVDDMQAPWPDSAVQLVTNLTFATAIARLSYWQHVEPLPAAADVEGLAKYWKKYYNTEAGAGEWPQWIYNYHKMVKPVGPAE